MIKVIQSVDQAGRRVAQWTGVDGSWWQVLELPMTETSMVGLRYPDSDRWVNSSDWGQYEDTLEWFRVSQGLNLPPLPPLDRPHARTKGAE